MIPTIICLLFIFLAFLVMFVSIDRGPAGLVWVAVLFALAGLVATAWVRP